MGKDFNRIIWIFFLLKDSPSGLIFLTALRSFWRPTLAGAIANPGRIQLRGDPWWGTLWKPSLRLANAATSWRRNSYVSFLPSILLYFDPGFTLGRLLSVLLRSWIMFSSSLTSISNLVASSGPLLSSNPDSILILIPVCRTTVLIWNLVTSKSQVLILLRSFFFYRNLNIFKTWIGIVIHFNPDFQPHCQSRWISIPSFDPDCWSNQFPIQLPS